MRLGRPITRKRPRRWEDPAFVAEFTRLWPSNSSAAICKRMKFTSVAAVLCFAQRLRDKKGVGLPKKLPSWTSAARVKAGRAGAAKRWGRKRTTRFGVLRDNDALDFINAPPATLYDGQGRAFGTLDPMTRERRYFETAQ